MEFPKELFVPPIILSLMFIGVSVWIIATGDASFLSYFNIIINVAMIGYLVHLIVHKD